ncbi:MAG: heat-inducible transcriptional repressor HrcA [Clostridia bacterium]|nr:heat-inducible transcriptional repressor HrcA [Clostridia bacterium]
MRRGADATALSERKEKILACVVELYVESGEPVGSKALLVRMQMSVSSATVRNEMAELDDLGYLEQPHTSAGRIPTNKGYRYYVDRLMPKRSPDETAARLMRQSLSHEGDPEKLIARAGEVLAAITNCAAVATMPVDAGAVIKRIEIVPIGIRTAMVVLMTSAGIVKTGVCRTDTAITGEMLDIFRKVCEYSFTGLPVSDMGTVMIQTLVASLGENALAMSPMFAVLSDLAGQAVQAEIRLQGGQNLLHHREFSSNAYDMLQFLDQSDKLERAVSADKKGLTVHIGNENIYRQLENTSMIIARYNIKDKDGGAIGIIGPTRLDYSRLIPSIEYLTELLGGLLTESLNE